MEYKIKHLDIISKMTKEEKAEMLSGKSFWETADIKRLGVPPMLLADGPHGLRKQMDNNADNLGINGSVPATCYPTAATLANSWDTELVKLVGNYLGKEAVSQEIHVVLGPGLNIKRSPLCGRNFEYFSEDPYLSGKLAAAYISGMQSTGVAACPKHFAANSQELRRMSVDSVMDERTLREIYTTGFEIAVKEADPKVMMTSYNKLNGSYTSENKHLLIDLLKDEWKYKGMTVTDWGASNDHVEGVKLGTHLEMPTTKKDSPKIILAALKDGSLSEEIVNRRVDELLDIVLTTNKDVKESKYKEFDIQEHHNMAMKAAEGSIVLLKNEQNILPLKKDAKIALIGDFAKKPRYQGAGSSVVVPTKLDSTLDLIKDSGIDLLGYEPGFIRAEKTDNELKAKAVALAQKAEIVVLYLGLTEISESEGLDRPHMRLPENQIEVLEALAKVNNNIVLVLAGGSAIEMPWTDSAKAIVHGYLAGQAGAQAILNVLTGAVCPSGRLSETYPIRHEDSPAYNYYPGEELTAECREGIYVGYRYYDTANIVVKYPFGYGLSYTSFEYSDLKLDKTKAEVTIKNTGEIDGAEVVQMYISLPQHKVFRPKKELKAFKKIYLKSGESKTIEIPFDDKTFRYFNVDTNSWEIEGGVYTIILGSNVRDIKIQGEISIEASNSAINNSQTGIPSYETADIKQVSDADFEKLLGRPIPIAKWDRKADLEMNDTLYQLQYSKSWIGRRIFKYLDKKTKKSMESGKPDLNVLFAYNITFRGAAKITGGKLSMKMAEAILLIFNGHFFRGLGNLIKSKITK